MARSDEVRPKRNAWANIPRLFLLVIELGLLVAFRIVAAPQLEGLLDLQASADNPPPADIGQLTDLVFHSPIAAWIGLAVILIGSALGLEVLLPGHPGNRWFYRLIHLGVVLAIVGVALAVVFSYAGALDSVGQPLDV